MNTIPGLRTLGSVEVARVTGNPRVLVKGGLLLVLVNIVCLCETRHGVHGEHRDY